MGGLDHGKAKMFEPLLKVAMLQRLARFATDLVDIQWGLLIDVLKRGAPRAHGRLLDVGCGNKPYEHLFRPYVTEYVGIEHKATFAETHASQKDRKPDFLYDGERLPFEDASFDTVLNVQVLEHTPKPQALIREMARVLRDDGVLILSAPFQFRLHEEPHDYFRYTPHGLRVLCEEAGLEVLEIHKQGGLFSVLAQKLNSFLAFKVARVGSLAQSMGKLPHEEELVERPRLWAVPLVAPPMLSLSGAARLLDRAFEDPEETLGFLIVARPKAVPTGAKPIRVPN